MNAPSRFSDIPYRLPLRVEDFERLEESGAFADHNRAELIDGDIYVANAQLADHGRAKGPLFVALVNQLSALGSTLEVFSEVSLRVADDSMPEPDIFVADWLDLGQVPVSSVRLVAEISDTTLSTDLGRKAALYAAAGIPEYRVVDLNGGRVVIHLRPGGGGYAERTDVPFGAPLTVATIDGLYLADVRLVN